PGVPKQDRDSKIGRDRKHVPHQRATEILPDPPVVRHRRHIPRHPEPADVDTWENRRANYRKQRHRFRGTVDRRAPFLVKQKQNCGDECAGVSDTNPENEIGNVPGPADRDLISPCADARGNLVANAKKSEGRGACSDGEGHPPPARGGLFHHSGDPFRQPAKVTPVQNKRYASDLLLRLFNGLWCCWCSVHTSKLRSSRAASTARGLSPRAWSCEQHSCAVRSRREIL